MDAKFSQKIKDVLSYSKEEAVRLGNAFITPEHFFLGIIREGDGIAIDILVLKSNGINELKHLVECSIKQNSGVKVKDVENMPMLKSSERILKMVYLEARLLKNETVTTGHLLLAILREESSAVAKILMENNINYNIVKNELEKKQPKSSADYGDEDDDRGSAFGAGKGSGATPNPAQGKPNSDTPVLDNFGVDLSKAAEENRLDPIVGREREIERLIHRIAFIAIVYF